MTKRVLVVDDEPEVTFALQAYFLGKGYKMLTALNGEKAMQLVRESPIDLVVLDMKMPGVNGVEVLRFIHSQTPRSKVIVVTGFDDQYRDMVERIGVDGFLTKPFGIEALTTTVEDVLSGRLAEKPAVLEESPLSGRGPKARAKLLFVEPAEYTYKLKEVFFSSPDRAKGIYEVMAAYSTEEALEQLAVFQPDILLVDLSMLGPAGELALKAMASPNRPKELIIHGSGSSLSSSHTAQMEDLSKRGVKVIYNESFTRSGLMRLGDVIWKTAVAHGLVEVTP